MLDLQAFRQHRVQEGWTQQDLARKLGVNVRTVKRWEGGTTTPVPYHLELLAELGFNVPQTTALRGETRENARAGKKMEEPKSEHPSTYFIEDRFNQEEIERLISQDRMMTEAMGGVLPEQPDPACFHRVLDVGCGTGGWLLQLVQMYPHIHGEGTDISKVILDYAREQAVRHQVEDRVEFHLMDALRMLEFPAKYFDLVNLRFGSSFLRTWDWLKLLQEMRKVSKSGGIVRISDTVSMTSTSPIFTTFINEMLIPVFIQAGYFFRGGPEATADHLKTMLSELDFQDVHLKTYPVEYRAGTPQHRLFVKDMRHVFHLLPAFWRKWSQMPEHFEELCQHMLVEMEHPDFVASWPLFTIWGTVSW